MNKDDLKKMLEDDFFGEGDPLDGLEDISLDFNDNIQPKNTVEPDMESTFKELDGEEKDIFDLDGFEFDDDENLLGRDLDISELNTEFSFDDDEKEEEEQKMDLDTTKGIFGDIAHDVESISNKSFEPIEETEELEEVEQSEQIVEIIEIEPTITEIELEIEEDDKPDYIYEYEKLEDNNTFTNYVQNDTINIEDNYPNIEENEGIEMEKTTLNYNDFSDAMNQEYVNVKKLDFPEINNQISGSKFKVDLFSNIPVTIDVYLGKTTLSLKDVHDLSKGSVIELDKFYGEPLELRINGELIATGEVVSIDNKYGIMIKDIVKS